MIKLRGNLQLFLIWLAVCVVLVLVSRDQIASGIGWGPDDQLRQVQLRDWIAGQSWFDTAQYRIGFPDSQPMHWPRLIEIPLALVVVALTPLFGAVAAETTAMVLVPLFTIGIAMWLVYKISHHIFDMKTGLLAAVLTATAVPVVIQLRPMRIDHHGWQVVFALVALWTMFWPDNRKGGLILGLALALWLSISLEGLPLSIAFIALLAWRWVVSLDEGVRLFWSLAGFLGGSVLLYFVNHGQFDPGLNYCDAISPAHLFACAAGAAVILPGINFKPRAIPARLSILAAGGAAALAVLYFTAPQCLGSAFGGIDPLVRDYWLVNVGEGLPVWKQGWKTTVTLLGGSIFVGLATWTYLIRKRPADIDREDLFLLGYAFLWSFIVSLLVQRASAVAAAYALPLMAFAVHKVFEKARAITNPAKRILATAAVIFIIMPGPLFVAVFNMIAPAEQDDAKANDTATELCTSPASLERLNALPPSNIVAPFNLGPKILVQTPHSVLATSHHRNDSAMADQIGIFTSSASQARKILKRRDIEYVVLCPNEPESEVYAARHKDGLWADLSSNKKPDWLQPVHIRDSGLKIWRITKN